MKFVPKNNKRNAESHPLTLSFNTPNKNWTCVPLFYFY